MGTTTVGSRTLAPNGMAALTKRVNATTWYITGAGLT
jgi:hypothetical protein